MISAGIAMMVLALAALVMVLVTDRTDADEKASAEEPVAEYDGLPRVLTTV